MRLTNWKVIVEKAGIAAILVGLFFVYLEIQQNGVIARAELVSGTTDKLDSIHQQLSDPEFAMIYVKGLHTPLDLTETERNQLNAFFQRVTTLFTREFLLHDLDVFAEYENIPREFGKVFFSSGYGNAWWNVKAKSYNPAIVAIVNEELSKLNSNSVALETDEQIMQQLGDL